MVLEKSQGTAVSHGKALKASSAAACAMAAASVAPAAEFGAEPSPSAMLAMKGPAGCPFDKTWRIGQVREVAPERVLALPVDLQVAASDDRRGNSSPGWPVGLGGCRGWRVAARARAVPDYRAHCRILEASF